MAKWQCGRGADSPPMSPTRHIALVVGDRGGIRLGKDDEQYLVECIGYRSLQVTTTN